MSVTKAIIPVAGYGTRRFPVSKTIEKCMLPVLNRPIVDYVVQDCIAAGIRDFYFVINDDAQQLPAYYQRYEKLEDYLQRAGKEKLIPSITPPADCQFHFVRQAVNQSYGTTVPVWMCRDFIQPNEKFLVIMGDQFFFNPSGSSEAARFLAAAQAAGTPSAMLAVEVPHAEVSKYGIVELQADGQVELYKRIVEKPPINEAPSNLNNASFYLFDHAMFEFLGGAMDKLHNGELMIIDALNDYVNAGNQVAMVRAQGEYLDCGTVEGWLHANNRIFEATK